MMTLLEALPTVIGTAAIAPALLMLWLVIAAEERPGPPAQVWTAFLLGAASISLLGLARARDAFGVRGRAARGGGEGHRHRADLLDQAADLCEPHGHRGLWRGRRP